MKLFFAGTEAKCYQKVVSAANVQCCLQSAFYLRYKKQPNEMQAPIYVLDSGGFTARKQGTLINVEDYANYLNAFDVKVAFNLDTMDVEQTLSNQSYLEKNTKTYIIPVYHYSEFIQPKYRDLIDDYAKNYPYISLGGTAEGVTGVSKNKLAFFDFCFRKVGVSVKIHGLAVTSFRLMLRYPWFSVDSTSWLAAESFGKFIDFKNGKFFGLNSHRVDRKVTDPRQLVSKEYRLIKSIEAYIKAEKYVTDHWQTRGVIWNEQPYR